MNLNSCCTSKYCASKCSECLCVVVHIVRSAVEVVMSALTQVVRHVVKVAMMTCDRKW